MAVWESKNCHITDEGSKIISAVALGDGRLEVTRIAASSAIYTENELLGEDGTVNYANVTQLRREVQNFASFDWYPAPTQDDIIRAWNLEMQLQNWKDDTLTPAGIEDDVANTGYRICQVGVYGRIAGASVGESPVRLLIWAQCTDPMTADWVPPWAEGNKSREEMIINYALQLNLVTTEGSITDGATPIEVTVNMYAPGMVTDYKFRRWQNAVVSPDLKIPGRVNIRGMQYTLKQGKYLARIKNTIPFESQKNVSVSVGNAHGISVPLLVNEAGKFDVFLLHKRIASPTVSITDKSTGQIIEYEPVPDRRASGVGTIGSTQVDIDVFEVTIPSNLCDLMFKNKGGTSFELIGVMLQSVTDNIVTDLDNYIQRWTADEIAVTGLKTESVKVVDDEIMMFNPAKLELANSEIEYDTRLDKAERDIIFNNEFLTGNIYTNTSASGNTLTVTIPNLSTDPYEAGNINSLDSKIIAVSVGNYTTTSDITNMKLSVNGKVTDLWKFEIGFENSRDKIQLFHAYELRPKSILLIAIKDHYGYVLNPPSRYNYDDRYLRLIGGVLTGDLTVEGLIKTHKGMVPVKDNDTDIGQVDHKYNEVYASLLHGLADSSVTMTVYPVDTRKVSLVGYNQTLCVEIPGVTSWEDLNNKVIAVYTGSYSWEGTGNDHINQGQLYLRVNDSTLGNTIQNTIKRQINTYGSTDYDSGHTYFTDYYFPGEITRYQVLFIGFSGTNIMLLNPPPATKATQAITEKSYDDKSYVTPKLIAPVVKDLKDMDERVGELAPIYVYTNGATCHLSDTTSYIQDDEGYTPQGSYCADISLYDIYVKYASGNVNTLLIEDSENVLGFDKNLGFDFPQVLYLTVDFAEVAVDTAQNVGRPHRCPKGQEPVPYAQMPKVIGEVLYLPLAEIDRYENRLDLMEHEGFKEGDIRVIGIEAGGRGDIGYLAEYFTSGLAKLQSDLLNRISRLSLIVPYNMQGGQFVKNLQWDETTEWSETGAGTDHVYLTRLEDCTCDVLYVDYLGITQRFDWKDYYGRNQVYVGDFDESAKTPFYFPIMLSADFLTGSAHITVFEKAEYKESEKDNYMYEWSGNTLNIEVAKMIQLIGGQHEYEFTYSTLSKGQIEIPLAPFTVGVSGDYKSAVTKQTDGE